VWTGGGAVGRGELGCFVARGIHGSVYLLDANGQDCTDPRSDVAEARPSKDRDQRSAAHGIQRLVEQCSIVGPTTTLRILQFISLRLGCMLVWKQRG
jgi:hypothetical protein